MFERFAKSARSAVVAAQEQARALRSPEIRVEHLLLGLLESGEPRLLALLEENGVTGSGALDELTEEVSGWPLGPEDAEALRSIGIDLDAVRESLEANFGADALDRARPARESEEHRGGLFGHIPFESGAKKVIELALREALARKDKTIGTGHILLAILRSPNAVTTEILGGADRLGGLRQQVHLLLDQAA
ncbi:Clp protease N-terminal domain-containing protein [Nocardia sp. NPDC024068]|uniref:Clp protease N-terminal domain-containing protein n=1 Tax=Nocardia sp. NPDC024068 TaxID=3157197 RepID=UPI0033F4B60F